MSGGDEHDTAVGQAFNEATGRSGKHEEHGTGATSTRSSSAPATSASST